MKDSFFKMAKIIDHADKALTHHMRGNKWRWDWHTAKVNQGLYKLNAYELNAIGITMEDMHDDGNPEWHLWKYVYDVAIDFKHMQGVINV